MSQTVSGANSMAVVTVAAITGSPQDWLDSVRSLGTLQDSEACFIAAWDHVNAERCFKGSAAQLLPMWTLSAGVAGVLEQQPAVEAVLVVGSPVAVPPTLLRRALAWMRDDPRIASVSFLSNAAGMLSFPFRNSPTPYGIGGMDEAGVCERLRQTAPESGPVSLQVPVGPAVLVNASVLRALGGLDDQRDNLVSLSLAEFGLRSSRRGFRHVLDAGSYLTAQWTSAGAPVEATEDAASRTSLHAVDGSFPALHDQLRSSSKSPMAIALDVARSKVQGLRILIDGSCLGPMEMGTQVQTLALVRALLRRDDVSRLILAVPQGHLPVYAADLMLQPKVTLCNAADLRFEGADDVDILHRPFQPDSMIPWDRWQQLAKRTVVTLQDLIAYRIGSYHDTGDRWLQYRSNIETASRNADAIVAISADTRDSIVEERLPVDLQRIHIAKNGGDHIGDTDVEQIPAELVERGMAAMPFLLVLGASYSHKNRDLAIRTWNALRERGHAIGLVLAGAVVAKGSSRQEEALARRNVSEDALLVLPDVSSAARNWLLRHAAIVLYPTSAEGFGLVPFEAAAMGTPTAHVNFGPLRELIDSPDLPRDWDPVKMADYCQQLLQDPQQGARNIRHILASGAALTWDATATDLVHAYRQILAGAPRH